MNKPLFSIIIPTRERHQSLPYAIQTVLNQSYDNFELIIMDNFSGEETYQAVSQFQDKRIKYYRSPERLSMSDNWELALSKVQGDYINIIGDRTSPFLKTRSHPTHSQTSIALIPNPIAVL